MKENQQTKQRDSFNSRFGFVLACIGSAVGMGNIWLFPYRVGQYGGAAFLIPYFLHRPHESEQSLQLCVRKFGDFCRQFLFHIASLFVVFLFLFGKKFGERNPERRADRPQGGKLRLRFAGVEVIQRRLRKHGFHGEVVYRPPALLAQGVYFVEYIHTVLRLLPPRKMRRLLFLS